MSPGTSTASTLIRKADPFIAPSSNQGAVSLHPDALLVIGPAGGIAIPASAVPVLQPLATGGRHALSERDRAALDVLAPRLAVVGLRVDQRREGVRIAKAHVATSY